MKSSDRESEQNRQVTEVIASFEFWDGRRAREVLATYGGKSSQREIEVAVNERYVPRYAEIDGGEDSP